MNLINPMRFVHSWPFFSATPATPAFSWNTHNNRFASSGLQPDFPMTACSSHLPPRARFFPDVMITASGSEGLIITIRNILLFVWFFHFHVIQFSVTHPTPPATVGRNRILSLEKSPPWSCCSSSHGSWMAHSKIHLLVEIMQEDIPKWPLSLKFHSWHIPPINPAFNQIFHNRIFPSPQLAAKFFQDSVFPSPSPHKNFFMTWQSHQPDPLG